MVALADVEGHGLPASLHCRTIHTALNLLKDERPETIIRKLNKVLLEQEGGVFTTLFYCEISEKGDIIYVNAGHTNPYILHNRMSKELKEGTTPIGMMGELDVPVSHANMEKGDLLVIYSDGIFEQLNSKENQFGIKRLKRSIKNHSTLSTEQIVKGLYGDLQEYCGGKKIFYDDATLIVLKKL